MNHLESEAPKEINHQRRVEINELKGLKLSASVWHEEDSGIKKVDYVGLRYNFENFTMKL